MPMRHFYQRSTAYPIHANMLLKVLFVNSEYVTFLTKLCTYHKHAFGVRVRMQEVQRFTYPELPDKHLSACLDLKKQYCLACSSLQAEAHHSFEGEASPLFCPLHLLFTAEPVGQQMPFKACRRELFLSNPLASFP